MKRRSWSVWAWMVPLGLLGATVAAAQLLPTLVTSVRDFPDPFRPGSLTTISVTLSDTASVTIGIYDASGRGIRTLCANLQSRAWSLSIPWDGTNDDGHHVEAATYTYTVRADADGGPAVAESGTITVASN